MAESTLKDVIERMKSEGDLDRNSGKNSFKSIKDTLNVGFATMNVSIMSLRDVLANSNKRLSDAIKDETIARRDQQNEDAAAAARQTTEDKDKQSSDFSKILTPLKGILTGLKGILSNLLPKSKLGWLGLLFGALGGLAFLFKDFFEKYIVNPFIDLFLGGTETWLGKTRKWIQDNIIKPVSEFTGLDEGIVAGLAAAAAAFALFHPIEFLKISNGLISLAGALISNPWVATLVAVGAAFYALYKGMEFLAKRNADNEIERLNKLTAEADNAAAEGNKKRLAEIQSEIEGIKNRSKELVGPIGKMLVEEAEKARQSVIPLLESLKEVPKVGETTKETTKSVYQAFEDEMLTMDFSNLNTAQQRVDAIASKFNEITNKIMESEEFKAKSAEEQKETLENLNRLQQRYWNESEKMIKEGLALPERNEATRLIFEQQKRTYDIIGEGKNQLKDQLEAERKLDQARFRTNMPGREYIEDVLLPYLKVNDSFQQKALDLLDERALQPPGSSSSTVAPVIVNQGGNKGGDNNTVINNNTTINSMQPPWVAGLPAGF